MNYLVDTNVLLRVRDQNDPRYGECVKAVDSLQTGGGRLFVCCQVLAEFWVVTTRPCDANGCGLAFEDALTAVEKVRTTFACLAEPPDMADRWQRVVTDRRVMGKPAHDARIVALMLAHGVTHLLTLNPSDFARYQEITPVTPAESLKR